MSLVYLYLLLCRTTCSLSSLNAGNNSAGSAVSKDNGLSVGSASRGEAFSARENDAARGERNGRKGRGLRFEGDDIGMLEACDLNAEKLGMVICVRGAFTVSLCVGLSSNSWVSTGEVV